MNYTKGKVGVLRERLLNCNTHFERDQVDAVMEEVDKAGYFEMYEALKGILLVAQPCEGAHMEFEKTYAGMFRVHGNRLESGVEALSKAEGGA